MSLFPRLCALVLGLFVLSGCAEIGLGNILGLNPTTTSDPGTAETDPAIRATATSVPLQSERLTFYSERSGNAEIYTMNADGSGLARLTDHPAPDYEPAFAPNQRQIVFVSERAGVPDLYLVNSDGTNLRRLTDEREGAFSPIFSPDGNAIYYVGLQDGNRQLRRLDIATRTSKLLRVTPAGIANPAVSPDGLQIAFSAEEPTSNGRDIFLIDVDGDGAVINLTNQPGDDDEPTFDPQGQRIAFSSNRAGNFDIFVMNADGTAQTPLTFDDGASRAPSWSRDGSAIAFSSNREGNYEIYLINTNGSDLRQLASHSAADREPRFPPPPQRQITQQLIAAFSGLSSTRDLQIINGPTELGATLIEDLLTDETMPVWSPDGTRLAFVSDRDGNPEIYISDLSDTQPLRLTSDPGQDLHPSWSPDGLSIFFESNRTGNWEIFAINVDGNSEPRNLTNHPANDGNPAVSPDGETLAFASDRNGNFEIYRWPLEGQSQPVNLTNNPAADVYPSWSPESTFIAFRSNRDGNNEIYLLIPGSTVLRRLTLNPADDTTPTFSPDGQRIAFASNRSGPQGPVNDNRNYDIYSVRIRDLELQQLTDEPGSETYPDWRPPTPLENNLP
ncbi:MAG: hypothetical protein HC822_28125 [Oscillochloris sp.]|nr:hypothetical protein [Oscillochloris sp.]